MERINESALTWVGGKKGGRSSDRDGSGGLGKKKKKTTTLGTVFPQLLIMWNSSNDSY